MDRSRADDEDEDKPNIKLTPVEQQDAEERAGPSTTVVYASVASRGIEQLRRPTSGLWWSGVSAGIVLTTSVLAEGLLHHVLPDVDGIKAVSDLGYTVGFIIVILGRMQLFTENTITPVLPLLTNPTRSAFARLSRLWLVVLVANVCGAFIGAGLLSTAAVVDAHQLDAIVEVSSEILANSPFETLRYGVVAGFLIAALAWLMPNSRGSEFWVIFLITYIIALGDFTHVVAGSAEAFLLWLESRATLEWVFVGFLLPALVGNVLGGTMIFAALAYAQVREEIAEERISDRDPFAPLRERERRSSLKPPTPPSSRDEDAPGRGERDPEATVLGDARRSASG